MIEIEVLEPPKTMVHEIVYKAVMHALKIGSPGLAEAGRVPIALNAAIRASIQIDALMADTIAQINGETRKAN